jgi:Fe-S cluster assembly ATP-binding protein
MSDPLLKVRQLTVNVEDKEILHQVDLDIAKGETHVLMGPNGAGKSTLGYALMGNPRYEVTGGSVAFDGADLLDESADQRARSGLFLSFQNPLEVPGITLGNFIRNAVEQRTGERVRLWNFRKQLEKECEILDMDPSYVDRDLNVGFSGGEKKKAEILQLLMLKPKLAILDETDSGLDVDAVRTVSKGVEEYQKQQDGALLIITHNTGILSSLKVDYTHVLVSGQIVGGGDASLVDEINRDGYEKYEARAKAAE